MDTALSPFCVSLVTQLPVFVVFCVGINMAWRRRASQPRVARLTYLALGILFVTAVGMTGVYIWLPRYGLAQGWGATALQTTFTMVGVVRHVLEAMAFALLLRAIFASPAPVQGSPAPALASPARAQSHGCLGLFLGVVLGAVSGAVLALVLGEPLGMAFNISTFEGERGFFIVFFLVPLLALVGAVTGIVIVLVRRRGHSAGP